MTEPAFATPFQYSVLKALRRKFLEKDIKKRRIVNAAL